MKLFTFTSRKNKYYRYELYHFVANNEEEAFVIAKKYEKNNKNIKFEYDCFVEVPIEVGHICISK